MSCDWDQYLKDRLTVMNDINPEFRNLEMEQVELKEFSENLVRAANRCDELKRTMLAFSKMCHVHIKHDIKDIETFRQSEIFEDQYTDICNSINRILFLLDIPSKDVSADDDYDLP